MNTNRATAAGRRDWREILRDQEASGLSVAEYCRQTRRSAWTVYSWRARLRAERKVPAKFVEVKVARRSTGGPVEGSGSDSSRLELHLPGGRYVVVRRGFDGATLLALLQVLEANPVGRPSEEADA